MKKIVAIITIYYPKKEHLCNINKIAEQVDTIFLCDNTPFNNEKIFNNLPNLEYLYFGKNLGLSLAFNFVLNNKKYNWDDDDYIIFFDQDTMIPKDHIKTLISDYEYLVSHGYNVGCIGPVFFNNSMQKIEIPKLKKQINASIIQVTNIITSSMLCKYSQIRTINFWNEEIFLDLADWDLCWRLNSSKKFSFMSFNSIIKHNVGEGKKKIFCVSLRIAKPFREYYQTRDKLYLLNKNYVPIRMKIRFLISLIIRPIVHFIFLDDGIRRMKYIFKGINDYLNNKRGELNIRF